LDRTRCLCALAGEVVYALIVGLATGVVLHAGAVTRNGAAILLPGKSGAGKSCLCAWLASKGFSYITDECVVLHDDGKSFTALPRPLIIKDLSNAAVRETLKEAQSVISGPPAMLWPKSTLPYDQNARFGVIVFPRFAAGTGLSIEPLSAAETALNLTAYNANARNLPDHGLSLISAFAREVPAIAIRYGGFDQLETGFDAFLKLITDRNGLSLREVRRALALIKSRSGAAESLPTAE